MSMAKDGACWGPLDTLGPHSDEAVLHDVNAAHAVLAHDFVQVYEELQRDLALNLTVKNQYQNSRNKIPHRNHTTSPGGSSSTFDEEPIKKAKHSWSEE
ncbi:hypothetical protein P7K49_008309 [Saguinus oedipus]|uniref:Uncharacterized protein n=1 Tax=Saguinus oedipus TaxID=9490 RepID=A0ABQ9VXC2_SAGOE|nr:hypothetical protein P7K49_008309 [Saguinus oedipus]